MRRDRGRVNSERIRGDNRELRERVGESDRLVHRVDKKCQWQFALKSLPNQELHELRGFGRVIRAAQYACVLLLTEAARLQK